MLIPPSATIEARMAFNAEPPSGDKCQNWLGAKDRDGYAVLSIDNRQHRANRVALSLKLGRPLTGMALHTCHNPSCVNQDHLYEGTNDQNMADKVAAGRQYRQRGELCPTAKLTERQVIDILMSDEPNTLLAKELQVSYGTIYAIKTRRLWSHVIVAA